MDYKFFNDRVIIFVAFAGALLIISFMIILSYRADKQHQLNTDWVIHTHRVLAESEQLYSSVKDAQRGQRGYLLVQDDDYLVTYNQARDKIGQSLDSLQQLTADNPAQQKRVTGFRKIIRQSLLFWDYTIRLNDEAGTKAAIALVKSRTGKKLVDELGLLINDFQQHEQGLLQQRQDLFEESKQSALLSRVVGWSSCILLLVMSFVTLITRLGREEELSGNLDKTVRIRTEQLQVSNQELQSSLEELDNKNKELVRTNVDLDNFVYTASHDLRSPINNLEGFIRVLKKKLTGKTTPAEEEILSFMEGSVSRLTRTIGALTEVARIQKEDQTTENVYFEQVLDDIKRDISPLIGESHARILSTFEVPSLHYPFNHLRSILYNLVSNAIKYRSPERVPAIGIRTWRDHEHVCLSVTDNGLGLDQNQLSKIFIMFKRLHTHVEGSGVGLYMVKRIVENNGGTISVQSQKNLGTTFLIHFNEAPAGLPDKENSSATYR